MEQEEKKEERPERKVIQEEERPERETIQEEERPERETIQEEEKSERETIQEEEEPERETMREEEKPEQETVQEEEEPEQETIREEERPEQETIQEEEKPAQEIIQEEEEPEPAATQKKGDKKKRARTNPSEKRKKQPKKPDKKPRKKRKADKEKIARGKALHKEHKKQRKQAQKESGEGRKKTLLVVLTVLVLVLALVGTGGYYGYTYYQKDQADKKALHDAAEAVIHLQTIEQAVNDREKHFKDEVGEEAGRSLGSDFLEALQSTIQGILNRPPYVELTVENAGDFVNIESCLLDGDGQVEVKIAAKDYELPMSDDGYYYLFSEKMYEDSVAGKEPITKEEKDISFTLSCSVNNNSASSRLYQKFVVAVLLKGEYVAVSRPKYITNPEAIAAHAPSFFGGSSKKGLLVDPAKLAGGSLSDLGVKHAAYNIMLSRILGSSSSGQHPTINYSYNGKNYSFDGHYIAEYDHIFSSLTAKGIEITAIVLNDHSAYSDSLIHPQARDGGGRSHYYAFNNTNEAGIDAMGAVATFLANRYSGTGHGKVMNWIIGNEVNVRRDWNYIAYMDVKQYSRIYADSIRVFYNGIKSANKNARIYISLDQQWNRNKNDQSFYDGRDILDEINSYIKSEGDIDWCVAFHPYNYPLTATRVWTAGKYDNLVTDGEDTSIITMKNIHVLTNYLKRDEMRNSSGDVRRVSISEVGYSSSGGQEVQAASFAYCYKKVENDPYIDSILLNRQTDHPVEVAQGLALGIDTYGGGHKAIYNVFKYIDTEKSDEVTKFARDMIGISSWSQIMK